METNSFMTLEDQIYSVISHHRQAAFKAIEEEMFKAYEKVGSILKERGGLAELPGKKVNGISSSTLRELYLSCSDGKDISNVSNSTKRQLVIEFIKAQSLSYEVQKAKYPNFLKPWTEDEEAELERLWCEGCSIDELADALKRHPKSVISRIVKLDLKNKYDR